MAFALFQGLLVVPRRFSPQLVMAWVVPSFECHLSLLLQVARAFVSLLLLATAASP